MLPTLDFSSHFTLIPLPCLPSLYKTSPHTYRHRIKHLGRNSGRRKRERNMSYYNQQQPPVGVPPPQGYPVEGYAKDAYPPQGYPPQAYPPPQQAYPPPPQYAQPPPPRRESSGCIEGCLAALCCCCLLDACF